MAEERGRGRVLLGRPSPIVTRGEVWLYEPPSDKRRPVLILARDERIERQ
jgi:hypothetical protein